MEEKLFPDNTDVISTEDTAAAKKKKHKKGRKKWILIAIAGVIAGIVIFEVLYTASKPTGIDVETAAVYKGDLKSTLTTNGTLGSMNTKDYYSSVTASINECNAKEGTFVAAGTKVIGFDTTQLAEANQKAMLTRDAALAGFQDTLNKSSEAAAKKSEADSKYAQCQSQIDSVSQQIAAYTQAITERTAALTAASSSNPTGNPVDPSTDAQIVSWQSQVTSLQSDLASYKEQQASAQATSTSMESVILSSSGRSQISSNSDLASLEADAATELLDKGNNGISTDFDGVITKMYVSNGTAVAQGTALFTLASLNDACVNVNLTKSNFASVKEGQTVEIHFNDFTYSGTVTQVGKTAASSVSSSNLNASAGVSSSSSTSLTSNVPATIKINNPDQNLCLGLEAKVTIQTGTSKGVMIIPRSAVSLSADGTFCYVVKDGAAVKTVVETGISTDNEIEVKSGLAEGDQVITNVPDGIEDGTRVKTAAAADSSAQ